MNKAYDRINWKNYPSEETALNESNLNRMDAALNEVDTRVVTHETTKLDVATANTMVRNISFNERTGIFTVTYLNGSTKELDTKLEKIATNFEYDAERQKLILTLVDGSTQEIDISDLITEYEFENSAYINWTVESGKVKAEIIDGSITADKLQPNFLADCRLSESNASMSANASKYYSEEAKKYANEAKGSAELANTDKIVDIMNQATTTWVMPDYMENRDEQPYVCGIGTPEENGYIADDYNDENGYGEPYLDVRSGMVYHAIRVKDLPLTYGWVEKEQLESVQDSGSGLTEITYAEYTANKAEYDASGKAYAIPDYPHNNNSAKVLGYSIIYNAQLTTNPQTFTSFNGRKFSDYDFVVAIMSNNGEEVRASTMCPISIFQTGWPLYVDHWSAGGVTFNQHLVKYVDDTHIQANATTSETVCKYLNIYGFKLTT